MNTVRLAALTCGCACACAMQAAQADSYDERVAVTGVAAPAQTAPANQPSNLDADTLAALPVHIRSTEPVSESDNMHFQYDSGTLENVHRIVGFWPSVHWLNSRNRGTSMAALGYTWRNLRLEGALFKERDADQYRNSSNTELLRFDSIKRRLSYDLGPNWAFQLSRGFLKSPDQFRLDQKSKRSTASLTYRNSIAGNPWHTTMAFGKGKGLSGENSSAYLVDSAVQLGPQHTVFGRFERAGHDELFREEEGPHDRAYMANKTSVGYVYEVKTLSAAKVGMGGVVSYRSVPNELLAYYGDKNTSYTLFVRLQMKFN